MRVEIELKNYRCFPMDRPARFAIGPRLTGLIGMNNAGKSALLRFFFEFRNLFAQLSGTSWETQQSFKASPGAAVLQASGVGDQDEVFSNLNGLGMEIRFRCLDDAAGYDPPIPETITLKIARATREIHGVLHSSHGDEIESASWNGSQITGSTGALYDMQPWLDFFRDLSTSLYIGPFRNAIQVGGGQYYDLQIGQGFIAEWDQYKSGSIKANNDAALQMTEEIRSIFGFDRLDINAAADNQTLQVIINGRSYRLDEVGGGIAHFIIVLTTAAVRRPPFLFMDEPELNLHPSLQLSFLMTVARYATEGAVFATHSLGLARAAGAAVYSVRSSEPGQSELHLLEGTPRLAEFLGELGLSGYQELGYDHVLLVEGPTDVAAVQQLLRLYNASHRIVLIHLGGSATINAQSAVQLEEITRLSANISALIDSERSSAGEAPPDRIVAFSEACANLGIQCHLLERRALENYFADRAVKEVKGGDYRALEEFELLRATPRPWGKDENWRIAGAMTRAELAETDLGLFLERLCA